MSSAAPSEIVMETTAGTEIDLIGDIASEIENISKEAAFEMVPVLLESVDFSYFKLGGVLSVIQDNGWWEGESETFKLFIPERFGLQYRKAMYLINIYNKLVEANIPWHKVSGLGWTKLKELADILTINNVDDWVELAETLTTLNLKLKIKAFKAKQLGLEGTTEPEGVSTITFTVHPDQKETINEAVEKGMEDAGTEFKGVALEAICLNFLAGGNTGAIKSLSLKGTMEKYTPVQVLEAFEAIWPEINITAEMD